MIELRNIKVNIDTEKKQLEQIILKKLRLSDLPNYEILKRSIDARKKPDIFYNYQIGVFLDDDKKEFNLVKKLRDKNIIISSHVTYKIAETINKDFERICMKHHPLIIGAGPAGLFCAYILARYGYKPIIVERGSKVNERVLKVNDFWDGKGLDPECNVQFGEGGAGTFSDGKLNTQVKDKYGRIRFVLEEFVKHGADPSILYDNKPHIGTDVLVSVVSGMRKEIESLGGTFLFDTKATMISVDSDENSDTTVSTGNVYQVILTRENEDVCVDADTVVLAIGHSARDTFSMLYDKRVSMTSKDFAMGIRIEHPQQLIRKAMYGEGENAYKLPTPPYKLTYQTGAGRGVYSFCMCPGGFVVNASSEIGYTAVNGMSYSKRDSDNSNSALIVTVRKDDFDNGNALSGIEFQRKLEKAIFEQGDGKVVVQRYDDFKNGVPTQQLEKIKPMIKGEYICGNVAACLPDFIKESIIEAMPAFNKTIDGFLDDDAIISGVESRTSSPIRIIRNEDYQSENIKGLYPCGEGAGYAGGIMSAAMDGMKVAEAIMKQYSPLKD